MTMYGANPEQLSQLGATLSRQIDAVETMRSAVDSAVANTVWHGPARDRFVEEWNGSFTQALTSLVEAFDLAGRDCVARADELRRVMGVG
ncbi:MAG: WXG100 family type VII secretion target [Ilumatobacteraceae bacterium]|nr:WXG100 family type VII secretion target [Ilumatobacteraceae bacterium]